MVWVPCIFAVFWIFGVIANFIKTFLFGGNTNTKKNDEATKTKIEEDEDKQQKSTKLPKRPANSKYFCVGGGWGDPFDGPEEEESNNNSTSEVVDGKQKAE